jgi:hypothetical protein
MLSLRSSALSNLFTASVALAFSEAQVADFVRTRKSDNPHLVSVGSTSEAADDGSAPVRCATHVSGPAPIAP